jgi:hypothetical protein
MLSQTKFLTPPYNVNTDLLKFCSTNTASQGCETAEEIHVRSFSFLFIGVSFKQNHIVTCRPLLGNDSVNTFPQRQVLDKQPVAK